MSLLRMPFPPFLFLLLILIPGAACDRPGPSRQSLVVSQIKQVATLSNLEVQLSKIIYGEYQKEFKFLFSRISLNEEKFVARTYATVKLGVDLSKIQSEDVVVEGAKIRLTLPAVEITSFNYPAEKFEILHEFSRNPYRVIGAENIDEFFAIGELTIRDQIDRIGLRAKAESHTRAFFNKFLQQMGFEHITIEFRGDPNDRLEELRQFEEFIERTRELVVRLGEQSE